MFLHEAAAAVKIIIMNIPTKSEIKKYLEDNLTSAECNILDSSDRYVLMSEVANVTINLIERINSREGFMSLKNMGLGNLSLEIMNHIKAEGFTEHKNNSYCYKETDLEWTERCYYLYFDKCSSFSVGIYIFHNGIGVDVDYNCGGNYSTAFWKFSNLSFEEAYESMCKMIERYID
jgi:hypothetical protein